MGESTQYAVTYRGLDGQCIVFEVAYTRAQREAALKRCQDTHPGCGARAIRADLIGVE